MYRLYRLCYAVLAKVCELRFLFSPFIAAELPIHENWRSDDEVTNNFFQAFVYSFCVEKHLHL
jgi:hypothetical protein